MEHISKSLEEFAKSLTKRYNEPMNNDTTTNTPVAVILPVDEVGDHAQHSIQGLNAKQIAKIIGFPANCSKDDPYKVKYSWGFTVDGVRCGVWDYKGSYEDNYFSAFGPIEALRKLFGDNVKKWGY